MLNNEMFKEFEAELSGHKLTTEEQFQVAMLVTLNSKPYEQIAVKDLCTATGFSRKTFYFYFNSKEDCLQKALYSIHLNYYEFDIEDKSAVSTPLEKSFLNYFTYWYTHQMLARLLINTDLWYFFYFNDKNSSRNAHDFCSRDLSKYDETDSGSANMMLEFVTAGCARLVECWVREGFLKSPAEMARIVADILTGAVTKMY